MEAKGQKTASSSVTPEKLKELLLDRKWRLSNLYHIRDERGVKVRFQLNRTQEYFLDNLWYLSLCVKARQLGITTFFTILYLDQVLFSENKIAGIIAHRQEDMKRIFRGKILFALQNMPAFMHEYIGKPTVDTANELVFENGGNIFVSMSTRSLTPNFLHISEYGYICAHYPEKADEILHGAINSVHAGQMISIESTAEGREGHFYRLAMDAEKKRKEGRKLTPLDFKMFFFPWWTDERYVLKDASFVTIPQELQDYFKDLRMKHGIELTSEQKRWYAKKREVLQNGIHQQYPSTLDEAFMTSLEGAFYAKEMAQVYAEKRIGFFPYDPIAPVYTAWDLGISKTSKMVVVFFQILGEEVRFIDYYEGSNEGLAHYVDVLKSKPYRYASHILPWDVRITEVSNNTTREQTLWDLGLRNTIVTERAGVQDGIEKTKLLFHRFRFNEETTQKLTDALFSYQREWNDSTGSWSSEPKKSGQANHAADAVRMLAVSWPYIQDYFDVNDDGTGTLREKIESFF